MTSGWTGKEAFADAHTSFQHEVCTDSGRVRSGEVKVSSLKSVSQENSQRRVKFVSQLTLTS